MPVSREGETCRRLSRPHTAGYSHRTALPAPVVEAKEKLVNDRHPSGIATPPAPASDAASALYAPYGAQEAQYGDFTAYGDYSATTAFASGTNATGAGSYAGTDFAGDPLFGDMSGGGGGTGSYDATQWNAGAQQPQNYDPYAAHHQAAYDTGAHGTTAWTNGYLADIPAQHPGPDASGQWDANAWIQPEQPLGGTQQWTVPTQDTGAYDATQWNTAGGQDAYQAYEHPRSESYPQPQAESGSYEQQHPRSESYEEPQAEPGSYEHELTQLDMTYEQQSGPGGQVPFDQQATTTFDQAAHDQLASDEGEFDEAEDFADTDDAEDAYDEGPERPLLDDMEEITPVRRPATRTASRSRRRSPAKRSALLTVAVPSVCVMGVAGIAAASVGGVGGLGGLGGNDSKNTTASAPDATSVKPSAANIKLDTQLQSLSAGADDFADRASRTQERIDLKAQQTTEKKKAAEEAARKERLRPKFVLPVTQRGLSAYFGQAGVNWMSVHTGIDFPVSYGTSVMAATDGTVRTQWNSAYGNMLILTAMDGTETWYCHLSSYKVPSGTTVRAGDQIAFSGNSGNSTGPHLHFEVRPAGGAAIDPLPWLRSHGLDPT
ncbi:peptidoglycan DD-metalloendopeptidase family protein [Streptomyces sp. NPDC091209]|uniref:peptidoglycan DD-metalloendopeptidase family protein n=1 Tax=Streptomyces sp. NPDC091209 TaxID=3365974 RepID=UPI0037F5B627